MSSIKSQVGGLAEMVAGLAEELDVIATDMDTKDRSAALADLTRFEQRFERMLADATDLTQEIVKEGHAAQKRWFFVEHGTMALQDIQKTLEQIHQGSADETVPNLAKICADAMHFQVVRLVCGTFGHMEPVASSPEPDRPATPSRPRRPGTLRRF